MIKTLFARAVLGGLLLVGLTPGGAVAETVSVGPVEATIPFGNAKPQDVTSPAQIAPKETFTSQELAVGRSVQSEPLPSAMHAPLAPPSVQLSFEGTGQT